MLREKQHLNWKRLTNKYVYLVKKIDWDINKITKS